MNNCFIARNETGETGKLIGIDYMELIHQNGFINISIQKEKTIIIPDDILKNYLSQKEIDLLKSSGIGIFSITVCAEKPAEAKSCCGSDCCN